MRLESYVPMYEEGLPVDEFNPCLRRSDYFSQGLTVCPDERKMHRTLKAACCSCQDAELVLSVTLKHISR